MKFWRKFEFLMTYHMKNFFFWMDKMSFSFTFNRHKSPNQIRKSFQYFNKLYIMCSIYLVCFGYYSFLNTIDTLHSIAVPLYRCIHVRWLNVFVDFYNCIFSANLEFWGLRLRETNFLPVEISLSMLFWKNNVEIFFSNIEIFLLNLKYMSDI